MRDKILGIIIDICEIIGSGILAFVFSFVFEGTKDVVPRLIICLGIMAVMTVIVIVKRFRKGPPKHEYISEGSLKAGLHNHFCFKCGKKLKIKKISKLVDRYSEEGRNYDFTEIVYYHVPFFAAEERIREVGNREETVLKCNFIHKAFFCTQCCQHTEFVTQLSLEKIDKYINKLQSRDIRCERFYIMKNGERSSVLTDVNETKELRLILTYAEGETREICFPVKNLERNERAPYFCFTDTPADKIIE